MAPPRPVPGEKLCERLSARQARGARGVARSGVTRRLARRADPRWLERRPLLARLLGGFTFAQGPAPASDGMPAETVARGLSAVASTAAVSSRRPVQAVEPARVAPVRPAVPERSRVLPGRAAPVLQVAAPEPARGPVPPAAPREGERSAPRAGPPHATPTEAPGFQQDVPAQARAVPSPTAPVRAAPVHAAPVHAAPVADAERPLPWSEPRAPHRAQDAPGSQRRPRSPLHPAARGLDALPDGPSALPSDPARVALARHPARGALIALARAGGGEQPAQVLLEELGRAEATPGLAPQLGALLGQIRRQVEMAPLRSTPSAGGRIAAQALGRTRDPRATAPETRTLAPSRGRGGASGGGVVSLATMRLIRRLSQLVHLAEIDRRQLEARRQVRMAEDSAHARAGAGAEAGGGAPAGQAPIDLDTLGREVLAAVTHEFQSRTERRLEDPDVRHDVWW